MRRQKKFLPFLYLFALSLIPLFGIIFLVNPFEKLELFQSKIDPAIFLFTILFLALFFFFSFLFANKRRGVLASIFVVGLLILRFFEIRSIYHAILLLAIILLIEFLHSKRSLK
ncbi:MAG: hypothetical protein A3C27_03135 [Candidatus Levybacteria bacterium RIFCSPHIGHO2_02_FULL_39_36]|nr:MAG: hypothetical protein A3E68_01690 [Candidatus Levybacteria bacterium RIFCSPHIGHO2_12_FULL_39_39]OGH28540.1 MAG: hypothetical protein A3C27_03135 [Candidatus Levybacteria bacterium RIFCSPHIGHO2_02_FULL_39_36]OGH45655.1 MAG: hypothetical protein A3H82_00590 [Candidatus Levybacteria bacterium RIFCSPLOWO2_02_FULL_39_26]OGH48650.1 MAG: hypothetical protein A3G66_04745 [Candidatus Levybacteria bacterium RIFCSPLOWO2_12_FULL_39_17]